MPAILKRGSLGTLYEYAIRPFHRSIRSMHPINHHARLVAGFFVSAA